MSDHWRSVLFTFVMTLAVSFILNAGSDTVLSRVGLWPSLLILLIIIAVGVLFDLIGTAATAANEVPLHAMAGNKVPGAKQAIWLVRNADRVASFCNDVVGDISGTLAGAAAATIAFNLSGNNYMTKTFLAALTASLIVTLKRAEKSLAINKSTQILYATGKVIYYVENFTGMSITSTKKNNNRKKTRVE